MSRATSYICFGIKDYCFQELVSAFTVSLDGVYRWNGPDRRRILSYLCWLVCFPLLWDVIVREYGWKTFFFPLSDLLVSCCFKQPVGTCLLLSFILKITHVHLCSSIVAKISWRRYHGGGHPWSFMGNTVGNQAELDIQWCFPDQFRIKEWSTFDV